MGSSLAVLVLDEDLNLRLSLAQILREAGYVVSTACSPCEALRQLANHPFKLVFLDIGLMAGIEISIIAEIKRLYPFMPMVVLSPYLHSGENCKIDSDQMVHFLVKPVEPAEILDVTRSIIIGGNRPELSDN